ncbi:hypothetical protein GCM10007301_18360 [Azorhizobium oxalatiphilum]|uniref:GtrA/DPMS transmembrane domain-containing protein n=1 Tax=Azorhizobium oxalatiphilum TaxID=980631 RepID=A0A917BUB2_9HYPH|nr:GtrA family protein [Azorhizobium oxalatiphilum]GGF58982.1 hypothetical protein GCM10007301_18360 [Azorhizobium oxalatiphilum]
MLTFWNNRIVRYVVVGGLNTLFGFAVYAVLALTSLPTWLILILANVAAISFNFATTGGIVFRDLKAQRIPRFLITYGIIFLTYLTLIEGLSPLVGGRIVAMAIVVLPVSALNYGLQMLFVFNRGSR